MKKLLIILFMLCSCAKKPIHRNVFIYNPEGEALIIMNDINMDSNGIVINMKGDWNEATAGDRRGDIAIYDADSFRYGKYRFDTTGRIFFDSPSDATTKGYIIDTSIIQWDGDSHAPIIFSCGTGDTTKRK